jgi:hypothetical protein
MQPVLRGVVGRAKHEILHAIATVRCRDAPVSYAGISAGVAQWSGT